MKSDDSIIDQPRGTDEASDSAVTRRGLLVVGCGALALLPRRRCRPAAATDCSDTQRVLVQGDRVKLANPEEVIEKAYQLGFAYEKEHGGCARCTVAALQDAVPFVAVDEALLRGSTCLDGGATPVAVQNCGGFTGAGMVIGHLCGSRRTDGFSGSAKLAHQLLHKVYYRFEKEYGTVLCRDVRREAKRDCPKVVGLAAKWTAEALIAEFAGYVPPK